MSERAEVVRAIRIVLAVACLLAAGCAGVKQAQQPEPVSSSPPVAPDTASVPPAPAHVQTTPAVVEVPQACDTPVQPSPIEPGLAPEPTPAARTAVPKEPPSTRTVTQTAAPQAPAAPAPAAAPAAAQVAPKMAPAPAASASRAPPLDLKSLEARLRQTKAIGILTKLSLKNQVDDLVNRFRAYHKRQATTTLAELRRSYDMLLLKVLSLLQDSDPALARDIVKSRGAIWGILEDPKKFTESNLMAGVTP